MINCIKYMALYMNEYQMLHQSVKTFLFDDAGGSSYYKKLFSVIAADVYTNYGSLLNVFNCRHFCLLNSFCF